MAGILMSPDADAQIRKRCELYKKSNNHDFRDLLRKRFKNKIKAKRGALLEQFRGMKSNAEVHNVLSTLIHEEVSVLREEICIEEMVTEDIPEENFDEDALQRHILMEYEKILEEEFNQKLEEQVVCPLCEKCALRQIIDSTVICINCSSQFPRVPSLINMRNILVSSIKAHDDNCNDLSQFALINDQVTNGLFLICQTCQYFAQTL